LYDRIEGLEERQLQTAFKYMSDHGQDTSAIVKRLKELQKK
jgi:glucan phosphoethanolaminetransferase (alkaline phosphatase superfamily)